jgi:tetratricopeptide (TPR) repeat protein
VRVVNLSLLNTDWYIDQMKRKAYNSDPIPSSLAPEKYMQGTRDYVPYYDNGMGNTPMDLKQVIDFIGSDDPDKKVQAGNGESMSFLPTKKLIIPVDTALVVSNGTVPKALSKYIEKNILWDLDKGYLLKADLAILDLLANNNWKRPVYFAITVGNESYLNLESYFQLEGLAYRIVPVKNPSSPDRQLGRVNTDVMYDNLMNKFKWGGMNDTRVYLDENNLRMTYNFRNNFGRLAEALMVEGKRDSALKVLDKCIEVMPDKTVPYNVTMLSIVDSYYRLAFNNAKDSLHAHSKDMELNKYGTAIKSANAIMSRLGSIYANDLEYYLSLKGRDFRSVNRDAEQGMAIMQELVRMAKEYKQDQLAKELEEKYNKLMQSYTAVATPR